MRHHGLAGRRARPTPLAAVESTHRPSFAEATTTHPALIPREVPATSRTGPRIPATLEPEDLLTAVIPADPRATRKRHDRPVTPEVAGSSPVALPSLVLPANGRFLARAQRSRSAGDVRKTSGNQRFVELARVEEPTPAVLDGARQADVLRAPAKRAGDRP